jgi:hypothetical protein
MAIIRFARRRIVFIDDKRKIAELYAWFVYSLRETSQKGAPWTSRARKHQYVLMLHSDLTDKDRQDTLQAACIPGGVVRLIIASPTGATGIDYPDYDEVILFKETDLAQVVQKFGRAGRTPDLDARFMAVLYWTADSFGADSKRYYHPELKVLCTGVDAKGNRLKCRRLYMLRNLTKIPLDMDKLRVSPDWCCDLCDRGIDDGADPSAQCVVVLDYVSRSELSPQDLRYLLDKLTVRLGAGAGPTSYSV